MKAALLLVLSVTSLSSFATSAKLCTIKNLPEIAARARKHSGWDKNQHCSISCMLSLRCYTAEVLLMGGLKEARDIIGPGEFELEDLRANKYGVDLVRFKRALSDGECLEQCDLRY